MARSIPHLNNLLCSFRNRTLCAVAVFLVLFSILYSYDAIRTSYENVFTCPAPPQFQPPRPPIEVHTKLAPIAGTFDGKWNFTRDSHNLLLTDNQCDVAFPGLFEEVERPLESRRSNRISLKEIDSIKPRDGYVRCILYNQRLYIIAAQGNIRSRALATINALHRAILTSPETLPNIEFSLSVADENKSEAQWIYARKQGDTLPWLMPDFGYFSWPEPKIGAYGEVQMRARLVDEEKSWKDKVDKLLWRGALLKLRVRTTLIKATKGKEWADVVSLNWRNRNSMRNDLKSMDRHCEYKYLAHTEGVSYSGRLKYLQNCRSVVIAHKLDYIQHHHPLMRSSGPEQNYVEVDREWQRLEAAIMHLRGNDTEAEAIADRMATTFRDRYLTPAAETCYWRKLMRAWAEVSFEPELFEEKDGKKKLRGLPVESYLIERRLDWQPY